jgi:hypothetical protein
MTGVPRGRASARSMVRQSGDWALTLRAQPLEFRRPQRGVLRVVQSLDCRHVGRLALPCVAFRDRQAL